MSKLLGMAYTQEGSGKDILLLHGWGSNKECFALLIRHLATKYRVTAVDFNGFGKSDPPYKPFSVNDYASRIEFFCGLLDIKPHLVLGHSFGGRVAIRLFAGNTTFGEKLVLADSAGIKPRRNVKYWFKTILYRMLKKMPFLNKDKLRARFGSADYAALSGMMRQTMVRVVKEDLQPLLPRIQANTLIIWGERDRETPPYMAKKLNKGIANSGLAMLEQAGHFSFIDCPRQFIKILDSFLGENGGNNTC